MSSASKSFFLLLFSCSGNAAALEQIHTADGISSARLTELNMFSLLVMFMCFQVAVTPEHTLKAENHGQGFVCDHLTVPLPTPSQQSFGECSSGSRICLREEREAHLWREETESHAVGSSLSSASGSEESLQRNTSVRRLLSQRLVFKFMILSPQSLKLMSYLITWSSWWCNVITTRIIRWSIRIDGSPVCSFLVKGCHSTSSSTKREKDVVVLSHGILQLFGFRVFLGAFLSNQGFTISPHHPWCESGLTLHHGDRVVYLRFEQVDSHHCGQVLHIHLVHLGVQLHLKQETGKINDMVSMVLSRTCWSFKWKDAPSAVSHNALCPSPYSPADIAEKVVVDSGEKCDLLLQLFPPLSDRLKDTTTHTVTAAQCLFRFTDMLFFQHLPVRCCRPACWCSPGSLGTGSRAPRVQAAPAGTA